MSGLKRLAAVAMGVAAAAGGMAAWTPLAEAVPTADALAHLNAQRYTHGLPAYVTESPGDTDGCRKHIEYMKANGGGLVHEEDPAKPGYTPEGDDAGRTGVLAAGGDWSGPNPWESAPIHLSQTLAPRLNVTGIADFDGYTCMTTIGDDNRTRPGPSTVVTYTYPGAGTSGHRTEEVASEEPFTPGELLGIPEPTKTGAYLYFFFDGPDTRWSPFDLAKVSSASLTGPDGPVEIRVADNYTTDPADPSRTLQGYTPTGGMLIPVSPLQPGAMYTAKVSATVDHAVHGGSTAVSHEWSFAAGGPGTSAPLVQPPGEPPPGHTSPGGPPSGQPSGGEDPGPTTPLPSGALKLRRPVVKGKRVLFRIRPSPVLKGRLAQVVVTKLARRCRRCSLKRVGRSKRRTLKLSGQRQAIKVRRPARGRAVRIKLSVANQSYKSTFERRRR